MKKNIDLSVDIGGIILNNPVMTASGTFGYAKEFDGATNLNGLGGIIVKGLSLEPSTGNPEPRVIETPSGLMNAVGLENVGIDAFITEKLPFLSKLTTPVFTNIYGKSEEDYIKIAEIIDGLEEISGIEVNISCPNVKAGGVAFGVDPVAANSVISAVRKKTSKHLIVKLSPNVTDITEIAKSVEDAGADAVSLINTITGLSIDINTKKPRLANITGGMSGPAIRPVAVRMVWQVANAVSIPVIGVGGIMCADDAIEFLIAGASAVQIGTGNLINPNTGINVVKGIEKYLRKNRLEKVSDLTGSIIVE